MKRMSLLNVYVKDQDAAIDFYTSKLGFVLAEDVPFGPQRWVTLRLPDDEVVSVSLTLAETNEERALVGKQIKRETISAAQAELTEEISPISDIRSTEKYRLRVSLNLLEDFLLRLAET